MELYIYILSSFLLEESKSSIDKITRLIKKAKDTDLIKPDPNKTYILFWSE